MPEPAPTLAAQRYHGSEAHRAESTAIFGRSWLCMGPAAAVSRPGSFVSEVMAGVPLVAVRDEQSTLRAFANVCAHRAGPLVADDGRGHCRSLTCAYHGWIYDLDGRLRVARDGGFEAPGPGVAGLREYAAAEWNGLLFVHLGADPEPLDDWLDPLFVERCAAHPLADWEPTERLDHDIAANWKTYSDNYLEGYHIPYVHPDLARAIDVGSYTVEVGDRSARHRARPRDGSPATGTWLWHWPNLAVNLYEHGGSIERWWPTGPRSCRLRLDFCFADTAPTAMARNRVDVEASAAICAEDRAICETVQRNLESGAYDRGVLAPRHEAALGLFHAMVAAATG